MNILSLNAEAHTKGLLFSWISIILEKWKWFSNKKCQLQLHASVVIVYNCYAQNSLLEGAIVLVSSSACMRSLSFPLIFLLILLYISTSSFFFLHSISFYFLILQKIFIFWEKEIFLILEKTALTCGGPGNIPLGISYQVTPWLSLLWLLLFSWCWGQGELIFVLI